MKRPTDILDSVPRNHPNAWKEFDEFRARRGVDLPKWPGWCYCPMAGAYSIAFGGNQPLRLDKVLDVSVLAAMSAWRLTKGIYRFDPDVYNALITSKLNGEIPTDVLYRLPEWCVYIETPGLPLFSTTSVGAWIHLEWDAKSERTELRLLVLTDDDRLIPVPIHLGELTLAESIGIVQQHAEKQAKRVGLDVSIGALMPREEIAKLITPFISLILYLCADEPEIESRDFPGTRPGNPQPRKIKGGMRMFEAEKVRHWEIGTKTGDVLRRAAEREDQASQGNRASPIPHVRRAHWHGYWSGPMTGPRRFKLKWTPPILVGV